jgi:hypothetical protein
MTVLLFWKDCAYFEPPQDAFWVECEKSELDLRFPPPSDQENNLAFLSKAGLRLAYEWHGQAEPEDREAEYSYFLVSRDGRGVIQTFSSFPEQCLWGRGKLKEMEAVSIRGFDELGPL